MFWPWSRATFTQAAAAFTTRFYVCQGHRRRGTIVAQQGDKQMMVKTVVSPEERHLMIAETAYFLAQERGFTDGDPIADWIEAERRVDSCSSVCAGSSRASSGTSGCSRCRSGR